MIFLMPGSALQNESVIPALKPPFDIIHRLAQEAPRFPEDTRKAASVEAAFPILLPLLDELRTYCYEHKIGEIPALFTV
jgi:hypothetical protein